MHGGKPSDKESEISDAEVLPGRQHTLVKSAGASLEEHTTSGKETPKEQSSEGIFGRAHRDEHAEARQDVQLCRGSAG